MSTMLSWLTLTYFHYVQIHYEFSLQVLKTPSFMYKFPYSNQYVFWKWWACGGSPHMLLYAARPSGQRSNKYNVKINTKGCAWWDLNQCLPIWQRHTVEPSPTIVSFDNKCNIYTYTKPIWVKTKSYLTSFSHL